MGDTARLVVTHIDDEAELLIGMSRQTTAIDGVNDEEQDRGILEAGIGQPPKILTEN